MASTGERVEQERTAKGWSQGVLARRVTALGFEIHQTTIDKMEKRGSDRPRCARELALALGLNLEWLLKEKGPKYRKQLQNLEDDEIEAVLTVWSAIPKSRRGDAMALLKTAAEWREAPSHAGVTLDPIDWENEGLRADDDRGRARSARTAIKPSNKEPN